jgi:hypothetical protein
LFGFGASILAWFALNFVGKPILTIQEKRREALEIGERYITVSSASSYDLRGRAVTALNDVGNSLRACTRERSIAVRAWCWLFHYDLDLAARCLFGLAEGARGEFSIGDVSRQKTLNALFLALGAAHHLSSADLQTLKSEIEKARGCDGDG